MPEDEKRIDQKKHNHQYCYWRIENGLPINKRLFFLCSRSFGLAQKNQKAKSWQSFCPHGQALARCHDPLPALKTA
ncbi:hypothetical protein [Algoriphagus antarcticus]|uniref:hypothetical protein n=1 Tax=Algoriphagus antarcticus TaxID=238540 RepID=UPI00111DC5F3|nr:hypothetical protein [Algoriphagus antarcticus]